MGDAARKKSLAPGKPGPGPKDNNGKPGAAKKSQPAPPKSAAPKANGKAPDGDQDEAECGAIADLLEAHEKELMALATDLTAETGRYDVALRELAVKLEAASGRLLQLERRFPTLALWKVENFSENFKEARSGRGGDLNSPPYYLSRQGYRLALSICLYGDGRAHGSHISLFVSICKGDYDGCLAWPFRLRVNLSIMDQTEDEAPRRNFTKTIVPRVCRENRVYLERPRGERNPRFGFEQFASLEEFFHGDRRYVHNNALFVKVEVQCEELQGV